MSDIELVIKINEKDYDDILNGETKASAINWSTFNAIRDGITLSQKQEFMLDKIRAEIDGLTYYWCEVNPRSVIDDILGIINKYNAGSEARG